MGMTSPQSMLLLGAAGMVAGLWFDAQAGGFATLAALCLSGPRDFMDTLALHWRQLPQMHLGMAAGGLVKVPMLRCLRQGCRSQFCVRLAQNLACSGWMAADMAAGALAFMHLAAWLEASGNAEMPGGISAALWSA